jgi:hypothetical protein
MHLFSTFEKKKKKYYSLKYIFDKDNLILTLSISWDVESLIQRFELPIDFFFLIPNYLLNILHARNSCEYGPLNYLDIEYAPSRGGNGSTERSRSFTFREAKLSKKDLPRDPSKTLIRPIRGNTFTPKYLYYE